VEGGLQIISLARVGDGGEKKTRCQEGRKEKYLVFAGGRLRGEKEGGGMSRRALHA